MIDDDTLQQELSHLPGFPRHGWACFPQEPSRALLILPFLGLASETKSPDSRPFTRAYNDFRGRVFLLLKAVELWHGSFNDLCSKDGLLLNHLFTDTCLCQLAAVFDSLPRLMRFEVDGNARCCRNFPAFREWVLADDSNVKSIAPQVFAALQDPGLERVKQVRNRRTHELSCFHIFVKVPENKAVQQIASHGGPGKHRRDDVVHTIKSGIASFFRLLEGLTPAEAEMKYAPQDVLGYGMGGYPNSWSYGPWLEEYIPKVLQAETEQEGKSKG